MLVCATGHTTAGPWKLPVFVQNGDSCKYRKPGNNSLKINASPLHTHISRSQLLQACVQLSKKNLPETLALSVCFTILSILALIFRVVSSWLQDGCRSPGCYVCIPGGHWEKTERVTPVWGRQEFPKKSQDTYVFLAGSVPYSHLRDAKGCRNTHTWQDQPLV